MIDKKTANPRRFALLGFAIIFLTFGGIGGWAATAKLDSAVIAPGRVVLEGDRQSVQHLEGGIVSKVHVREGDFVEEGDLLVEMDRVSRRSDLDVMTLRRNIAQAQEARFLAERNLSDEIIFPASVAESSHPQVVNTREDQVTAFESRKQTLESERSVLRTRIGQLEAQIDGLERQQEAVERRLEIQGALLERFRQGGESGVLELNALAQREDSYIQIQAELGQIESEIARTRLQQNETEMQIVQAEREYRERASEALDAVRQEIAELNERIVVAEDALRRTYIRASATGTVQNVAVATEGAVVSPGALLMEIVPVNERFVVSANVEPQNIDSVETGLLTEVRFTAITEQVAEVAMGRVLTVSRDIIQSDNRNEPPHYLARISIDEDTIPEAIRTRITAGMPVDVIMNTGERTVLTYLVDPLTDAIRMSMREE
jgi:HlyD family secretion protein